MIKIEIDKKSGCCFGVERAISRVEQELKEGKTLYCLGDIVHNKVEVNRLEEEGMITIDHEDLKKLKNVTVLLRAHGEPPSTYEIAKKNNIEIIDASCPVVLRLQQKIKTKYESSKNDNQQIVIYGKKGHAEVNGLIGQTKHSAIVIENKDDLNKINFSKNITLFSQTTKPLDGFKKIIGMINSNMKNGASFESQDTICRQVSNRVPNIQEFVKRHDLIFFIAGKKSSNGKILFDECKKNNPNSYFIESPDEIDFSIIRDNITIGLCGATSTPKKQIDSVAEKIVKQYKSIEVIVE